MRIYFLLISLVMASLATPFETIYHSGDTTANYYTLTIPKKSIERVFLLLPCLGKTPEQFLSTIGVDSLLQESNTLLMVASPEGFLTHYCNEQSMVRLEKMLAEVAERFDLGRSCELVLGGFSIGGTGALRFAEQLEGGTRHSAFSLAGVMAVDPPLDLARFWHSMEHTVATSKLEGSRFEAQYMLDIFSDHLGGSPEEVPSVYRRVSPFLASEFDGGAIAWLRRTPVRLYVEPALDWWKEHRGELYENQNSFDIDQLEAKGALKRLMVSRTENCGVRPDGSRHPHSWSIVHEPGLIAWMESL